MGGQPKDEEDEGPVIPIRKVSPLYYNHLQEKERWVKVVGDFLSKESRGPNKPTRPNPQEHLLPPSDLG